MDSKVTLHVKMFCTTLISQKIVVVLVDGVRLSLNCSHQQAY
jgi:hypothetical protein